MSVPTQTVTSVAADKVALSCGHELHRLPRFDREWKAGEEIACHDCAQEASREVP